ncbi:hypothetical protein NSZ01_36300 [Nocardioides szechwanensis]|uniref:Uncharacterized protein n=1 Tax=Nocardioides szechwanensis TaxID=1005944 RepID=A0A1G9ZU16_9ACTN|nr:hypothetical protein [Nocardioides szechwanensis]GEP35862.1 hypothetical protein NSZ01_36300 [Nocardioides szechwanensis]SDN24617.1 hypothetical protein SAMN05192576_1836 [Nocardioides szechwanensis]
MHVKGFDERHLVREGPSANFVVFIYEGGDAPSSSWSVDSLLLTDTDVPQVLHWLRQNLPTNSCWSLGVVLDPEHPTPETDLQVVWIVGADILNADPQRFSPEQRRVAEEMLARRDRVDLP